MPTLYTPIKRTIGELLTMTNPSILVPEWQRNYSWTTSEVDTFWKDLTMFNNTYPEENIADQEYFLGSIVIVDNNIDQLLLDGQQRLATSAILISVIRDFLQRFSQNAAIRVSTRYLTDFDDAQNRNAYKLTLNRYDRDFFRREILESRDAEYTEMVPTMDSHRLIKKAREFFIEKFEHQYQHIAAPDQSNRWALRILRVLTQHMSVVAVISRDEDNAATVFETLNDRGIGLSTPDLVRNLILRRSRPNEVDEIIELWRVILEIEGDSDLKTFLRHFWLSREGDVKTQSLYKEIKEKIVQDNTDSLTFSRELRDSSLIYRDIVAAKDDDPILRKMLLDVKELGANLLYPAILSAYEVMDINNIKKILQSLITTFVRYNVIGGFENSRLEDVIFDLSKHLRENQDVSYVIRTLIEFSPSDEQFTHSFSLASVSRRLSARYILKEIELNLRRTEEIDVAPSHRVHVEHIYPQSPLPGERWNNHLLYINRLGNLTLLSRRINSAIQNGNFLTKKPSYEESELLVTSELLDKTEWTPEQVDLRQLEMSKKASIIWSYPEI